MENIGLFLFRQVYEIILDFVITGKIFRFAQNDSEMSPRT